MKRRLVYLALLCLVVLGVAGGTIAWAWRVLHTPFGPDAETRFDVAPGSSATRILADLEALGLIPDARLARLYLVYVLDDPHLQTGEYGIETPASTPEILEMLVRGDVLLHPVTVIEGLTLEETAERLAAEGFGDRERFLAAMRSPDPIADLDPEAVTLEGYLFPDTYRFHRATTEKEIVRTLVATFRRRFARELAALSSLPPRELVTLASIIEKEARLDGERPIIAGVYRNRLDRGIALYADPTIIFALKQMGTWDGDLRRRDLELDSPYNTYRYPGLPPRTDLLSRAREPASSRPAGGRPLSLLRQPQRRDTRLRRDPAGAQSQRRRMAAPLLARAPRTGIRVARTGRGRPGRGG